jgi:large subunit ribosomal protein L30
MATIKVKQVRSIIKTNKSQKDTMRALGFKKMNQVVEHENTPQIQGMIRKVEHLIKVIE